MRSLLYGVSVIMLILLFMIYPKSEKKLPLLSWLALALFGYELFASFAGAILTILNLPANISFISIVNCLVGMVLLIGVNRKTRIQKYTVSAWEIIGVLIIAVAVFCLGYYRFEGFKTVNYETSDPAVHMRMAMECINGQSAAGGGGMIISQFTNALWIEMLAPICSGAYSFRAFIIKDVYNLFLAGILFFVAFSLTNKRRVYCYVGVLTMVYLAGYPLSNLLFGFQYLGLGVSTVCFLFLCANIHSMRQVNRWWTISLLNLGCIGSSLSYTLFAPIVYIALFLFLCWDYLCEYNFAWKNAKRIKGIVSLALSVFLIPTLLSLYYIVILQLTRWGIGVGTALSHEGYIYRNLYSDFILILPFALYGWWTGIKEKALNLLSFLAPLAMMYCGYFLWKMVRGDVSTYYYYKLNYLNAFIIYGLGAIGLMQLLIKTSAAVNSYLLSWGVVFLLFVTGWVSTLNGYNINLAPFADEAAMFRIFQTNKFYLSHNTSNHDWIILSDAIDKYGETDRTNLILGDWLSCYWYEALANETIAPMYPHLVGSERVLDMFINDESYSDYMVVISGSEEALAVEDQLTNFEIVFQCDSGYIIKRNS